MDDGNSEDEDGVPDLEPFPFDNYLEMNHNRLKTLHPTRRRESRRSAFVVPRRMRSPLAPGFIRELHSIPMEVSISIK